MLKFEYLLFVIKPFQKGVALLIGILMVYNVSAYVLRLVLRRIGTATK